MQLIITDQSAGAVSWEWHFGNGVTDTLPNPNYIYTIPGDYTLSLQTKDSSGCVSTFAYPNTVKVHQSARASFSINDSSGCTPFLLQTINNSSNADSLLWSFGNGVFSTDSNPVYIYNQAGIYNLSLYALSKFGCNDTLLYPAPLIVNLQPTANFNTSDSAACLPFGIQFNNTSVNLLSPSFSWHFGNGDTSVIENPLVVFNTAGTFDVSLTVTNIGGCYDEISVPGLINIYDPLPPPPTQLYSVSIIDANQAEVKWKAINLNDIDYYSLYRLNTLSGLYDSIGSVLQLAQPVPNIFSSIDAGVNTGLTPLTYKILATDKCGSRVAITQLAPHTSVFVTGSNNGGNIDLNWTAYLGCNVNGYMIYRSDDNGITFNYLTQTSSNVLSFTDTTSFCPFVYYYKIKAIGICNENDANAYSNAAAIDHTAYTWEQKNSVTRATVVDNRYVLVEWGLTDIMQQTVTGYNIFRSIDNINFPLYRRVNANQNYFEDYSVDLQHSSYYYRVSAFNFCNTINPESNVGSSILLKGDFDKNGKSLLRWTQYKDWTDGVDHYVLEKLNINGIWEPIKITDPKTTETDDDSN